MSGFAFTALLSMFNSIFDGRVVAKLPFTPIYWVQGKRDSRELMEKYPYNATKNQLKAPKAPY